MTYIPPQDKNRKFINQRLGDIVDITELPSFTYGELMRRAKTVDVIWFNEREMPSNFYEVEHTTDIKIHLQNSMNWKTSLLVFISLPMLVGERNLKTNCTFQFSRQ